MLQFAMFVHLVCTSATATVYVPTNPLETSHDNKHFIYGKSAIGEELKYEWVKYLYM